MIDGYPIELGGKIVLHPPHEIANEGFEICDLAPIFGGYDQSELMSFAV